jgi:Carboxypeptidase regulatory-like domain
MRTLLALTALALGIALLLLALRWGGMQTTVDSPPADQVDPHASPIIGEPDHRDADTEPLRQSLADGKLETSVQTTISGRVVSSSTGHPISGARVTVNDRGRNRPIAWRDPRPVVTGSDGRFAIEFAPAARCEIEFRVEATGFAPVSGGWWRLAPGARLDHGDVKLPVAVPTKIRVVTTPPASPTQIPVARFRVQVDRVDRSRYGRRIRIGPLRGTGHQLTDTTGYLPTLTLSPGRWRLIADIEHGWIVHGPEEFEIGPHETTKDVTIRVTRPDPETTISGWVEDTSGVPVVGLDLHARLTGRFGIRGTKTTDGGRFFFGRLQEGSAPWHVSVSWRERRFRLASGQTHVAIKIGTKDLRIVMQRRNDVPVELLVIAAESRAPITRFAWSIQEARDHQIGDRTHSRLEGSPKLVPMSSHENGRAIIDLAPGEYVLCLRTTQPGLADVLGRTFRVDEGRGRELRIEVPALVPWRVRVRDRDGDPVVGSTVQLVQRVGKGPVTGYRIEVDRGLLGGVGGTSLNFILDRGTTGADGLVTLTSTPVLGAAALLIRGPNHREKLVRNVEVPTGAQIFEVSVEGAAVITGRVEPVSDLRALGPTEADRTYTSLFWDQARLVNRYLPTVSVERAKGRRREDPTETSPVQADGSFRIEAVPPGDFDIRLRAVVRQPDGTANVDSRVVHHVAGLRAGETRSVVIDAGHMVPIEIRGVARLDGRPVARRSLRLVSAKGSGFTIRTATDGSFRMFVLRGSYRPAVSWSEGSRTVTIHAENPIVIDAGPQPSLIVTFRTRTLRVRLRTKDGEPISNRRVAIYSLAFPRENSPPRFFGVATTNAKGGATFSPVPPCQFEVRAIGTKPVGGVQPAEKDRFLSLFLRLGIVESPSRDEVVELVFQGR